MTCYPEKRKGRPTGKWIAEVTLPHIGRMRQRCDSFQEGERWADTVKALGYVPQGTTDAPEAPVTTWGHVVALCREAGGRRGKWKGGRDRSLAQRLDAVTTFIGAHTPINAVTTTIMDRLVSHLEAQGLAPSTINRYLDAASSLLGFAVDRGLLPQAPKLPRQSEAGRERLLWLSEAGEDAVVSALQRRGNDRAALMVRVLVATGMRWGELAGLQPEQIEGAWVRLWKTKTDRPRSIPISQPLASQLRALVASGGLLPQTTFRDQLKLALKDAGQDLRLCIHSLRHTTASRMIERGVNPVIVQRFMGHNDIQTTMRYTHINDDALVQAAEKITPRAGQSSSNTTLRIAAIPEKSTA
jgi:integrase